MNDLTRQLINEVRSAWADGCTLTVDAAKDKGFIDADIDEAIRYGRIRRLGPDLMPIEAF
jgi:hypothetical protein